MYHKISFYPPNLRLSYMKNQISVAKVIDKLPSRFRKDNNEGITAVFQFNIKDDTDFYIHIDNINCQVLQSQHPDPDITLIMNTATMVAVINGEIDGMSAWLTGKLRAEGNVMLATKLGKLFSREKQS